MDRRRVQTLRPYREVHNMKKDKKYGGFSYNSRRFRKSLAFLCLTALLIPSASMGVNAAGTAGQNAAQAGGWTTDTNSSVSGQELQFSVPQISVYYGQQLKDACLSATATDALGQPVSGTFSWVYPETVMDRVGTVLADAVFTPGGEMTAVSEAEQSGWASAEISAGTGAQAALPKQYLSVNVTVEPAPVDVVEDPWTATTLKEGLFLKDVRLEGGKAMTGYPAPYGAAGTEEIVRGSFSWADPDAALTEGVQDVEVIFTPDRKEYRAGKTVLTLEVPEAEEPETPEEPEESQEPEKPQRPEMYLSCPDIFYGETVKAEAWAEGDLQPFITYTYEGNGQTVYPESETPPKEPGSYVAYAQIHESELFEPTFLYENFQIKRAVPDVDISADQAEVKGGGRVSLKISVKNPYDFNLKKGLPAGISLSFSGNPAIRLDQDLKGSDGSYTAAFSVPDENGEITCRVYTEANGFYESGGAVITVRTKKNNKPSGGNQDSGNRDDGKHEDHKKEEEEPVIKTPEEVEAEFWQDVIFRIYKAQETGGTVTINAKGHGQMPDKVMEALRGHNKVTLALVWEGDMILIPAGKAPAAKKGNAAWTLMELSGQFPAPKAGGSGNSGKPSGGQTQPSQTNSSVNLPVKPAPGQNQTGSSGNAGNHFSSDTVGGTGGTLGGSGHTETESTETTEEAVETETESTEAAESVPETETDAAENEDTEKQTDWFTVAACVCAGAGLIAVLVAVAALVLKNRGEL